MNIEDTLEDEVEVFRCPTCQSKNIGKSEGLDGIKYFFTLVRNVESISDFIVSSHLNLKRLCTDTNSQWRKLNMLLKI